MRPSIASIPTASLSKLLSIGDGVLNGALGAFGVTIPPDVVLKRSLERSSMLVPKRVQAL